MNSALQLILRIAPIYRLFQSFSFINSFLNEVKRIINNTQKVLEPELLVAEIGTIIQHERGRQEDAGEFIIKTLENIQNETRVLITEVQVILKHHTKCPNSNNIVSCTKNSLYLFLNLQQRKTRQELINDFSKLCQCSNCGKNVQPEKNTVIEELSKFVFIQINRFNNDL